MSGVPKPIRISRVEWVCMRNDPVLPKAIIRLVKLTPAPALYIPNASCPFTIDR